MLSCGNKRSHMAFDALQIVPCNYVDLTERNIGATHIELTEKTSLALMYYP